MTEKSDIGALAGNVVDFAAKRKAVQETISAAPADVQKVCESLLTTLEAFQEGMTATVGALMQHETRLLRLEKMMGEAKRPAAILALNGKRIR